MCTYLRKARYDAGLTVVEVASRLGVHVNTVYAWERGRAEPRGRHLLKLAELYKTSPDRLLRPTA